MGRKQVISVFAALAALAGCNTSGCLDNQSALPLAEFYSSATGAVVSVDSLEVVGVGAPDGDVLSEATPAKSQLYLPMRSTHTSTSWRLIYRQKALAAAGVEDEVGFDYESIPYFASEECGATYRYRITRVHYTTNVVDSVVLTDSLITNVDRATIRIYFHTSEQPGGEGAEQ